MNDPGSLSLALKLFTDAEVDFILIGGAAALLHGASQLTQDVDFCCKRVGPNFSKLSAALNSVNPRFRVVGIAEGVPARLDDRTLHAGSSFDFITDIGNIDVRFDVDGIGGYEQVLALSEFHEINESTVLVLSIDGIIQTKRAMSRPRDLTILPELEILSARRTVLDPTDDGGLSHNHRSTGLSG